MQQRFAGLGFLCLLWLDDNNDDDDNDDDDGDDDNAISICLV